jgi:hypothetical protein
MSKFHVTIWRQRFVLSKTSLKETGTIVLLQGARGMPADDSGPVPGLHIESCEEAANGSEDYEGH